MRRTPLARVSKKRRCETQKYGRLRKAYLLSHPLCEACIPLLGWKSSMPATEIHHREGRGVHLNEVTTFVAICRTCHLFIHQNPKYARSKGLLK